MFGVGQQNTSMREINPNGGFFACCARMALNASHLPEILRKIRIYFEKNI